MKVAKNMDSVFANCTEDELDFDLLFSNDDTIIDFIAGVDEAGIPLTGPNYDYSKLNEAEDMLEDEDDLDERLGKIRHNGSFEGTEDDDLEIGAEVGDGKEVSGREHSAESEAHDMIELGSETAKQKAIEKAMEIGAQKFADADSVKENCDYDGYTTLIEAVINGFMTEEDILSEDAAQIAISTADYMINECEDTAAREGQVDKENRKYIEGIKARLFDAQTVGSSNEDPIEDDCDCGARLGKTPIDNKNIEGVVNRVIGAAMEAVASGNLDMDLDDETIDHDHTNMDDYIVPDDVRDNTSSNDIDIRHEMSEFVQNRYAGLVGVLRSDLQKLALAQAMDESVLEIAGAIKQASIMENCEYEDYSEYQKIIEAVIAELDDEQLAMENCTEFVIETVNYIIDEADTPYVDNLDDDDIEAVANEKDDDVNPGLEYGYDDDELIDMAIDDDEI